MDLFLKNVKFTEDFRVYKKDEEIEFKSSLTIITGDNGSGKSSLISCIRNLFKTKWTMSHCDAGNGKITSNVEGSHEIGYFDTSADLHKNAVEFDFDNMSLFVQCTQASSGQGTLLQLANFFDINKDKKLLILDEPERGLSLRSEQLFINYILKSWFEHPEMQILITTHSPLFMSMAEVVFSTSHKKYITHKEYLDWMKDIN